MRLDNLELVFLSSEGPQNPLYYLGSRFILAPTAKAGEESMTHTQKPLVFFVDDEKDLADSLAAEYSKDYDTKAFTSPYDALRCTNESVAVVVADQRMPSMTGVDLLAKLRTQSPDTVRILLTAVADLNTLMESINVANVFQYIPKEPLYQEQMKTSLAYAVELYRSRQERKRNIASVTQENAKLKAVLRVQTGEKRLFEDLVGNDPKLLEAISLGRRAATNIRTVLITGESGTGKEVLARAIHFESKRTGPFKAENCASYTTYLAQALLFGKELGAYTDSREATKGILREAEGGTVFLDEIGELNRDVQGFLLRFLENGDIHPLGYSGKENLKANDVRIITATNQDLDTEVQNGKFRLDLFYRINRIRIHLPPLRDRRADIPMLVQHALIAESAGRGPNSVPISDAAISYLQSLPYPGNIRELNNTIARAMDSMEDDGKKTIEIQHVRAATQQQPPVPVQPACWDEMLKAYKKQLIESALKRHSGKHGPAAAELQMTTRNLLKLIGDLGISTE